MNKEDDKLADVILEIGKVLLKHNLTMGQTDRILWTMIGISELGCIEGFSRKTKLTPSDREQLLRRHMGNKLEAVIQTIGGKIKVCENMIK